MAVQERTRGAQGTARAGSPRGRRAQAPGHLVCPAPRGAPFPVAGGCPAGPWEVPAVGTREGGDLRTCQGPWTGLARAETHPGGSSPPAPTRAISRLGDVVLSARPSLGPLTGPGPPSSEWPWWGLLPNLAEVGGGAAWGPVPKPRSWAPRPPAVYLRPVACASREVPPCGMRPRPCLESGLLSGGFLWAGWPAADPSREQSPRQTRRLRKRRSCPWEGPPESDVKGPFAGGTGHSVGVWAASRGEARKS